MEILLTRHGQTEWNLLKKVQGKADIELNEKGIKQAEETRDSLKNEKINPIISLDYPDPDVIRVGDTYYMVSTTMHFFPCCEILRS